MTAARLPAAGLPQMSAAVSEKMCIRDSINTPGPVYLRLGRAKTPGVYPADYAFEPGKITVLRAGGDVTIAACGMLVAPALDAAQLLRADGIDARVLNVSTIKPLDQETLLAAARETGAIVTCEEHNILGGLGGAVAEAVAGACPVPVQMCIRDSPSAAIGAT